MIHDMPTICAGPHWIDHFQDENKYALSHLQPTFVDYFIPSTPATRNKPGRTEIATKLRILYSHHCFTQATDKLPLANHDHFYTCTSRNETRVFCVDRWSESINLPSIVTTLQTCFFTRHHNYFVIRNMSAPELGEYFVYFTVKLGAGGKFVELNIESAYPRLDGHRESKAQKVSFNVLVVNTIRGVGTRKPQ